MPRLPIRLTNRGPAGLLNKLPASISEKEESKNGQHSGEINRIAPEISHLSTPISQLVFDPNNARKHPERNMDAIRRSLDRFKQQTPIVIQRGTNVIVKGNGTTRAALDLGWTHIAAVFSDLSDIEALEYGITDNRTAELATWDFEQVQKTDAILHAANIDMSGWSTDELKVMRCDTSLFQPVDPTTQTEITERKVHTCPQCGHEWTN